MIGKQGVSLLIGHNGLQDKTALNPANETVNKGIYDPTLLSTVDPDLAPGNIKDTVNIFGKVGTLVPTVSVIEALPDIAMVPSSYSWKVERTASIPATAKKVHIWIQAGYNLQGYDVDIRAVYNGVVRCESMGSSAKAVATWIGDGVGSAADLNIEMRYEHSVYTSSTHSASFYITL